MFSKLPDAVNAEERLLLGICERLDKVIDLLTPKEKEDPLPEQITIEEVMEPATPDYTAMSKKELVSLLEERGVEFDKRKSLKWLVDTAKRTE